MTLSLFIPLSLKIASKRSQLAKQIYAVVKKKLDKINHWLDWYLYLQSWGNSTAFLCSIQKLMRSEIQLRNQDSIWRGWDLYSISFGKLMPISVILVLSLWAYPLSSGLLTTFWLAVPIIDIIITYNRFRKRKQKGILPLKSSKEHINRLSLVTDQSMIIATNDWEIWNGSLGDNVCEFHHEFDVLSKLHLKEEFLNVIHDPFAVELELKGKNLSSGQKTRLLLARGINLSLKYKHPLYVRLTFESLDSSNKTRIALCLKELAQWIPVHLEKQIEVTLAFDGVHSFNNQVPPLREYNPVPQALTIMNTDVKFSLFEDILRMY